MQAHSHLLHTVTCKGGITNLTLLKRKLRLGEYMTVTYTEWQFKGEGTASPDTLAICLPLLWPTGEFSGL